MIRIITIEREYGCGAAGIARELAERLGWKLWDQLLTQEIARFDQSEVKRREERRDPLYYRLLKSFTLGSYEGNSSVARLKRGCRQYCQVSRQVVRGGCRRRQLHNRWERIATFSEGPCRYPSVFSLRFPREKNTTLDF